MDKDALLQDLVAHYESCGMDDCVRAIFEKHMNSDPTPSAKDLIDTAEAFSKALLIIEQPFDKQMRDIADMADPEKLRKTDEV